jgi:acyl-CoA synthetase (AMP-forming)/AMP-acid ligase II
MTCEGDHALDKCRTSAMVSTITMNSTNSVFWVPEVAPAEHLSTSAWMSVRLTLRGSAAPSMSMTHVLPRTVQSVPDALAFWAAQTPDAVALLSPGREPATYQELQEAVRRLAGRLRTHGLHRQDGIALVLPEGPDLCVMLLATIAAGIAVPLAWPNPEAVHARILANPRVRAVVVSAEVDASRSERLDHARPMLTATRGPSGRIGDLHLDGDAWGAAVLASQPAPEDIAVILHSSGTTGPPKLVPRTHRNLVLTSHTSIDTRGITSADRCLCLSRAAYAQGMNALMTTIVSGSSLLSVPGPDMSVLPGWLQDYRPTYLSTTPAILRTLAESHGPLPAPLRLINSSAGALTTNEVDQLEAVLGVPLLNAYAMSEVSWIAGERFAGYHRVPGAVGIPFCEIRTVDERGVPLGQYESGEIIVRGPFVFPGYLDDPTATAAAFLPDGWFRTGDIGFVDAAGYLHLTGRLGETINRGGEKIVPDEVDAALGSHPAIVEAAVFAVPDALLGEDLVAAVVLEHEETIERKAIHAWLLDRLPLFKVPRRIWRVEELPRTPTGKVRRSELARRWSEQGA